MINQFLKWSLLITVWRRYGFALKVLPFIAILIVIIFNVHSDYVAYVEVSSNNQYLAWSFVLKWVLICIVIGSYWAYVNRLLRNGREPKAKQRAPADSNNANSDSKHSEDPFAAIRNKERLRSRADTLIDKK